MASSTPDPRVIVSHDSAPMCAAYAANLQRAEEIYRRVIETDATFAPAYRGLGEVYEQQKRPRDAAEAYLNYVKQAPSAPDRSIVMGRLRLLTTMLKVEQ